MNQFYMYEASNIKRKDCKTIIHCNAGVGRSGTFLIPYLMAKEFKFKYIMSEIPETKPIIDIFKAINNVRMQRNNCVIQAEMQFVILCKLIRRLIYHVLENKPLQVVFSEPLYKIPLNKKQSKFMLIHPSKTNSTVFITNENCRRICNHDLNEKQLISWLRECKLQKNTNHSICYKCQETDQI